ncbi:Oidioi.mRNA.OKI2018_I69.chr1.g1715.t1.cds [Oikopleura dioica]|uniref:Oidioi.mRNA.OKI2018_I69.chr1.g1715.t1.cds n=1 Tax=Oikopleura dioica TaxID=34765 RepID=A0ABN7SV29_OIKDI|nr:Oidioi.mRNA.OKI2018_I69.chr1.g1715.t1.cds [Oikopleura dioica]
MKSGEVLSAILLISGFGLCITAASLLSCIDSKCKDCWCKNTTEVQGVILLIVGTALLGVYGAAAANEDKVTHFLRSTILRPKKSKQRIEEQQEQDGMIQEETEWGESDCLQAGCCWNNDVTEIAYRCTKNDEDARRSLEARTTNTNYTDILAEVIAYHDSRAVWAVPFYTSIPFVIIAAFNWIKNIYQD